MCRFLQHLNPIYKKEASTRFQPHANERPKFGEPFRGDVRYPKAKENEIELLIRLIGKDVLLDIRNRSDAKAVAVDLDHLGRCIDNR